jgi:GT2 family glycosyltransferase
MGVTGVTAAICTHAGGARIGPALRSLLEQSDRPEEILVLDNAPPDSGTSNFVRTRFPGVRYEVEPVPGLDFARNAALERATQPIVAFLDDDAVAGDDWIGKVRRAFGANPKLAACCCRVMALRVDTAGRRLFEANGGLDRGPDPVLLPRDAGRALNGFGGSLVAWATRIAVGCGMSVRRREALELGGFDPALDLGAALPGGGDCDFIWRAVVAGHQAAYFPDVIIKHDHREEREAAERQIIGHSQALVALLTKIVGASSGAERRSALAFLGWRLVKPGVRLVKGFAGNDPLPARVLLRMWWASWTGLTAYGTARRAADQRRIAFGPPTPLHEGHS